MSTGNRNPPFFTGIGGDGTGFENAGCPKKFVDSYCNYLQKKRIIVSNEQWEICAYGLELIVSAILNIVILVMCSFVLHEERYINWCIVHGSQLITALVIVAATASVGTTCLFESYQPEVPECLRER